MHSRFNIIATWLLIAISLILSSAALYVKLYFWNSWSHAGSAVIILHIFLILAGPLSLALQFYKRSLSVAVVLAQIGILIYASIF